MYFLLVFSDNVEDFLHPLRYLMLPVRSSAIAADTHSQIPSIGASGVIVFYALKFPHVHLAFLMRWRFVWFRWICLPAKTLYNGRRLAGNQHPAWLSLQ
jgi:hypothetical protein